MGTTILQSLNPVPVEVTYDSPSLNVGMLVYKFASGAWSQVGSTVAALNLPGTNSYGAVWTPPDGSPYIIELKVFTDNTLTTPNTDYSASSRSFVVDYSLLNVLANLITYKSDIMAVFSEQGIIIELS